MNNAMAGIVIGGGAVMLWGLLWLYGWRCARGRRRWQARWDEFAVRQARLDAELDRTWRSLGR
ncbi:MAG: hypothetical protein ACRDNW_12485 [Trebonia sp.]